jgi:hypothetical protein
MKATVMGVFSRLFVRANSRQPMAPGEWTVKAARRNAAKPQFPLIAQNFPL